MGKKEFEAEEDAVKQIHEDVGGLPLALRIVVGTLIDQPFTPISDYATELRKAKLDLLKDSDDKDLDVRASFELSLKFLLPTQIDLFAYLGVCAPEGFALQTMQVVSEQPLKDVRDGLARLVRLLCSLKEMMQIDLFFTPYCSILLTNLSENAICISQLKNDTLNISLILPRNTVVYRLRICNSIESEINSLVLTAYRSEINHEVVNYGYYLALEPFFQARGYWSQALQIISLYLEIAKKIGDWHSVAQLLIQRGQFLQAIGKLSDAERALEESDKELIKVEDTREQNRLRAMVLILWALSFSDKGSLKMQSRYFGVVPK